MKKVNTHDAKTHLSEYLEDVERGETVVICRRNVPIAELRRVASIPPAKQRPIGKGKGAFHLPDSFFEPLPDDLLASFEGKD